MGISHFHDYRLSIIRPELRLAHCATTATCATLQNAAFIDASPAFFSRDSD
jgi:hypothetical protein